MERFANSFTKERRHPSSEGSEIGSIRKAATIPEGLVALSTVHKTTCTEKHPLLIGLFQGIGEPVKIDLSPRILAPHLKAVSLDTVGELIGENRLDKHKEPEVKKI
jgi:hypothetical protein